MIEKQPLSREGILELSENLGQLFGQPGWKYVDLMLRGMEADATERLVMQAGSDAATGHANAQLLRGNIAQIRMIRSGLLVPGMKAEQIAERRDDDITLDWWRET